MNILSALKSLSFPGKPIFWVVGLCLSLGFSTQAQANTLLSLNNSNSENPQPIAAKPGASAHRDVWSRLRANWQLLDHGYHRTVDAQLERYKHRPHGITRIAERSIPYLHHIVEQVEKRGMPAEIALLPFVESAFDPFAYSPGRAAGLWQFIPSTAKYRGIHNSWWYDGRRDVIESTDAALDYLQYLNRKFDGDWLQTLAAYNAGAGTVNRAIRKNRKRGQGLDYWALNLPAETEAYVPKLLALARLVDRATDHGIKLPPISNEPYFETVELSQQIDLAQAADLAELNISELYLLNPGFNRWATDPAGPHRLVLPSDVAERFRARLKATPKGELLRWSRYTVKAGDTLSVIAMNNHSSIRAIMQANGLDSANLRTGQTLVLPSASKRASHYALSAGQRLLATQSQYKGRGNKHMHTVRSGDSLWTIAKRYQVSVKSLTRWNGMSSKDPIRPGQRLAVWLPKKNDGVTRKVAYQVRNGDNLGRIAQRFRVNVRDIVKWNAIDPSNYLKPGQNLTLYVDVTNT